MKYLSQKGYATKTSCDLIQVKYWSKTAHISESDFGQPNCELKMDS